MPNSVITDQAHPGGTAPPATQSAQAERAIARARRLSYLLDEALEDSFPASDPISSLRIA